MKMHLIYEFKSVNGNIFDETEYVNGNAPYEPNIVDVSAACVSSCPEVH